MDVVLDYLKILSSDSPDVKRADKRNIIRLIDSYDIDWQSIEFNGLHGQLIKGTYDELKALAIDEISDSAVVRTKLNQKFQGLVPDDVILSVINSCMGNLTNNKLISLRKLIRDEFLISSNEQYLTEINDNLALINISPNNDANKIQLIKNLNEKMSDAVRQSRIFEDVSGEANDVILSGTGLRDLVKVSMDKINATTNFLKTGSFDIDRILGGGLENGTSVLLGSNTGGFKSGAMLNMALGVCEHNNHVVDENGLVNGKIPYVQYISYENTPSLTFGRLAKYILNKSKDDLKVMEEKEIEDAMSNYFDQLPIKFKMSYFTAYSQTPTDIEGMLDGVQSDDGVDMVCVCVVVDYLFLLNVDHLDYRLALAKNARGLADIAIHNNIPVVTALQLNALAETSEELTSATLAESKAVLSHVDTCLLFRKYDIPSPIEQGKYARVLEEFCIKARSLEEMPKHKSYILFDAENNFKFRSTNVTDSASKLLGNNFKLIIDSFINNKLGKSVANNMGEGANQANEAGAAVKKQLTALPTEVKYENPTDSPY